MNELSQYSDEELRNIAGQSNDISSMSDDELMRIAGGQPSETSNELSLRQGKEPSFIDKAWSFFDDPAAVKAKATLAIVDSEALNIHPSLAYDNKKAIDKYYNIDPERKQKKERTLQAIQKFNDTGIRDGWAEVFWKNIKQVPVHLQIAAGGLLQAIEENIDPEVAMNMNGAIPDEATVKSFELAREARDKKDVYSLGREVAEAGQKKLEKEPINVFPGSFKETVGMATQSTANNLLYLIPGFAWGRSIPLFMMGTQAMGESYVEQRKGGSSSDTALTASFLKGLSEAGTEFIPMGIYLKPNAGFVKRLVEAEFSEIPTEIVNTMVSDVIDKSTIRPDMTIDDALENIQQTIQVTALSSFALTGFSHSIHKAIAKTLPKDQKQIFADASKEVMDNGGTARQASKAGIEAVSSTPEGKAHIDNQINKMKQEAEKIQTPKEPFIIGVNENKQGAIQSFTMADPLTGNTFEVPAIEKEGEKDNVKYTPDPEALKEEMDKINNEDIDDKIDRLIEGDDTVTEQIFGEDVADFQPEEEITPEENQKTIIDTVKSINESLGERGSVDLEPIVNLGRSIINEGHKTYEAFTARAKEVLGETWEKVKDLVEQAWNTLKNERGSVSIKPMTPKKGTADIPAKTTPRAEAGLIEEARKYKSAEEFVNSQLYYHGTNKTFKEFKHTTNAELGRGYYFTPDMFAAQKFAWGKKVNQGGKQNIITVTPTFKKPLILGEGVDGKLALELWEKSSARNPNGGAIEKIAKDGGYDAIIRKGYGDGEEIMIFDKKNIKIQSQAATPEEVLSQTAETKADLTSIWNKAHETTPQAEAGKYEDQNKIIARPVKDVGLNYGDQLPDNVYLHGSKRVEGDIDNFSVSTSPGGTLYLTKNWDTAEIFSGDRRNNNSFIKAIELRPDADIIDLSKSTDRERLSDLIYEASGNIDDEVSKKQFADDLKNIDFHTTGISDQPEYGEILYNENIGAIKDNFGNVDVISDYAIKTYNPKQLPNPSRPPESEDIKYAKAGNVVDGRNVRKEIHNLSSIEASIVNPTILPGIYEIPLTDFDGLTGTNYSKTGQNKINKLADEISASNEITPLIVAIDKDGPYILEGATRAEALYKIGAKSFPAKVVIDGDLPTLTRPPEVGGQSTLYSGVDITQTLDVLRGLKGNIQEAMPHLEALGRQVYQSGKIKFNEWSASMKETLGDMWESFKDALKDVYEFAKRKLSEERGSISNREAANADPLFDIIQYIKDKGGLNYDLLLVDWGKEDVDILMKKRPGVVRKDGKLKLDMVADEWDTNDNDLMMDLLSNKNKKDVISKVSHKREAEYLQEIYDNEQVSRAEFTRAVNKARIAFQEGNAAELKKLKNSIKWMAQRKETLKNTRDYFGLTDEEMSKISRKNPLLMDEQEFAQYLKEVNLKAIDFKETQFARAQLIRLIEEKRLQKVDNYRRALELPSISEMTTEQLRQFAQLLEPFQNDDIFLTQRELETVDRTMNLQGVKTWRETKLKLLDEINRMRKEKGMDEVSFVDLAAVKVKWNDHFKWDASLREQDPFFDLLVTRMTEAMMGAEIKIHKIESDVFDLGKKSEKSRKRGIVERMIPKDELIFQYLEAPKAQKNAIAQQMTPEQLKLAHYMNEYFAQFLDYLISIKSIDKGRQNYITHIRKTFLENVRDKGLKEGVTSIFTAYQEDAMGFNILDDSTGKILPLEKFFQYSLHRTGELDPSQNVIRVFMTYVRTAERKKMFDAIIPELDIYTQSLTPAKYTPRGLEYDRSLKTFVNKWINNKKGRKISYDSVIRQGGPLDLIIRALRTFTTMLDLGFSIPVGIASFVGEQVTDFTMLGVKNYTLGTARMRTDKGQRILKKYEVFTGRSFWEDFNAPGKQFNERISDAMFGLFHVATKTANKQFLLGMMTEEEYKNEELTTERLADLKLEMGRLRVVGGTNSLVGSTSLGNAAAQYKTWAVPIVRTLTHDIRQYIKDLNKTRKGQMGLGDSLTTQEAKELYRIVGITTAVLLAGSLSGADDDDGSFIGKLKKRAYREATTLTQGIDPRLWFSAPRILSWLTQISIALHNIMILETYKTKDELKGVNQMKKALIPGIVRQLPDDEEE